MAIEWVRFGKPSALGAVTGMVAGLGTLTPASGFVGPGGALIIGLLAGSVCSVAGFSAMVGATLQTSRTNSAIHLNSDVSL